MKRRQSNKTVQLTVRNVPEQVKQLLVVRAKAGGKSLNSVLVEALSVSVGVFPVNKAHSDLDGLAGLWVEDPEFDKAILSQHQVVDAFF